MNDIKMFFQAIVDAAPLEKKGILFYSKKSMVDFCFFEFGISVKAIQETNTVTLKPNSFGVKEVEITKPDGTMFEWEGDSFFFVRECCADGDPEPLHHHTTMAKGSGCPGYIIFDSDKLSNLCKIIVDLGLKP